MAQLRIVDGFMFSNEEEYKQALKEQKAVKYLKQQMQGKTASDILKIYQQLLEQKLFKTEVGYAFLHDVFVSLQNQKSLSGTEIPVIKLESKEPVVVTKEVKQPVKKNSSSQVKVLRIMVVALLILVVAMFGITLTSTSPTILDYETKLQNKYASWEQELTQREAALTQREAQLNQ